MNRVSNNCDEVIKDLLDYDMCNQCFCAIKDILTIQREDIDNPITKSDLSSYRMKKLFGIVIGRKERNKKLNYDERFGKEFHPYKLIHQISEIEEGLWNHGYGRMQSMCASIRDRFQFLMTLSDCLRSESLYKAALCDKMDIMYVE